jgi:hypothetical protein
MLRPGSADSNSARDALLLATGLVIFTTIVNMVGVETMARINNFGVAVHVRRSPAVVFDVFGTGPLTRGEAVGPVRRVQIANAYSK